MENHKKVQQPFLDKNNEPIQMGVNDNLEKLKALFPSVVKDGFVDFTALKEELGEIEEVGDEKYNLTWWGKQGAKIEAKTPPVGKTLNYKENGNDNFKGETENLYIEGDNLEVLKLLKENYYGKIKMIYIDPPYNTGKDFVYKDNFHMSAEESDKVEGLVNVDGDKIEKRFTENTKGNRYHSNWLNMMYPRLKVSHSLLKEDGVIFISIDDNEVNNLRKVCDEIFGEDNFVSCIVWANKEGGGSSDSKLFRIKHEYILCYAREISQLEIIGTPITNADRYKDKDEYYKERGSYYLQKLGMGSIQYSQSLDYPIETPDGTFVSPAENNKGKKACWRWSKEKFIENKEKGFVVIKKDASEVWTVYTKQYMNCDNEGNHIVRTQRPMGIINEFSSTQASKLMDSYDLGGFFNYSKPVELIKYLVKRINCKDEYILDFFSGSATTSQAVMDLNAKDGGNRKFILVQLQEETREFKKDKNGNITYNETEASKAGYKNICEIGKERIRRAGNKIVEELKEKNKRYTKENDQSNIDSVLLNDNMDNDIQDNGNDKDKYIKNPELLDIGFKVFEVGRTNIKWNNIEDMEDVKSIEELMLTEKDRFDFTPHFTDVNVIYEIALQHRGVPLSSSLEKLTNIGERTYLYANSYLVCLEEDVTEDIIKKISQISPQPISYYFRDSAFGENIALKDDTIRMFKDLISINYGNNKGSYTLEFI